MSRAVRGALFISVALAVAMYAGEIHQLLYLNLAHITLLNSLSGEALQVRLAKLEDVQRWIGRYVEYHPNERIETRIHKVEQFYAQLVSATPLVEAEHLVSNGCLLAETGQYQQAADSYVKATLLVPRRFEAYYQAFALEASQGPGLVDVETLIENLNSLDPEYTLVEQFADGDWRMVGYDISEQDLLMNTPMVNVVLYWLKPSTVNRKPRVTVYANADGRYIETASWVYQITQVENLLNNSTFELPMAKAYIPFEYRDVRNRKDAMAYNADHFEVINVEKNGVPTSVLKLWNADSERVALTSREAFLIDPGAYYVVGAWMWGEEAGACWGVGWYDQNSKPVSSDYVVKRIYSRDWTYYSRVIQAPDQAAYVRPLIENRKPFTEARFDDVVLFELPLLTSGSKREIQAGREDFPVLRSCDREDYRLPAGKD